MKQTIFLILFTFVISTASVLSEDFSSDLNTINHAWDGQKTVTDKEFEEAINTLTQKQKKKDEKAKKKKIKKVSGGGTSLHKTLEPTSEILEQESIKQKSKDDGQLLSMPVDVIIDDKILEKGFYNVFGKKEKNGDIYLLFYQAHSFKGKIKAYKTNNDFNSETLDFVQMSPYNDNYIKIMFGSLDFNAYAYLRLAPIQ